jgi:putative Mn2+ efflux pump MntP
MFSSMAAGGHVLASLVLAGIVALVGLRFQKAIETQQGHLIGVLLVLTGLAVLIWSRTGRGRSHGRGDGHSEEPHEDGHEPHPDNDVGHSHAAPPHAEEPHRHEHGQPEAPGQPAEDHTHEHRHAAVVHAHPHSHEEFIESRRQMLIERSQAHTLGGRLAAITVPFGVAASPDLTLLPVALAASAFGVGAVVTVLVIFAALTMVTFVGLTLVGTIAGYQIKGTWLEDNANTVTALVLVAIGVVAYIGF